MRIQRNLKYRRLATAFFAIMLCSPLHAQTSGSTPAEAQPGFKSVFTLDGPNTTDSGGDMSTDSAGNIFIAGSHGGLDLDGDGDVDLAAEFTDSLFMKLHFDEDTQDTIIDWTRSPIAAGDQSSAKIAPDQQGGVFGMGRFRDEITFDDGFVLEGGGGNDAFVARYSSAGDLEWARRFGGAGQDALFDLVSDDAGNAYTVGMGGGPFQMDPSGTRFPAPEAGVTFAIASYDLAGLVRWVYALPPRTMALILAVSPLGELYVSGEYEAAVDFDKDGTVDLPNPGSRGGFVARFDSNGEFLGAWSTGGGGVAKPAFGHNGDVFLMGSLSRQANARYGAADFDRDGTIDLDVKGGSPTGTWIARYSPTGTPHWLRSYALERAMDLQVKQDRLLVVGSYHGIRDIDEDGSLEPSDTTVDPNLESELAILVISDAGDPEYVWTAPGPGHDIAAAASFLPNGPDIFVTGYLQLTADFSGSGIDGVGWRECEALGDFFLARYRLPVQQSVVLNVRLLQASPDALVELTWSGATTESVNIYRDDVLLTTTENDRVFEDGFASSTSENAEVIYRVCDTGNLACSNYAAVLTAE